MFTRLFAREALFSPDLWRKHRLLLPGVAVAGLLFALLLADTLIQHKREMEQRVAALQMQERELNRLAQALSAAKRNPTRDAKPINALLPWLEQRLAAGDLGVVEHVGLKSNAASEFREVVSFRLSAVNLYDLLPLLQQIEDAGSLRLLRAEMRRGDAAGISFDAELGLLQ